VNIIMPLNSLIDDDLRWDCDECEAKTPHEVVEETVTPDDGEYYIDTGIQCTECGHEHEVSEATPDDPRA